MNSVTLRGAVGAIHWGYFPAGTVRVWTVTRHDPTDPGTLTATIDQLDSFRVSQRPLEFVVTHQHGRWRWPIATLQIADGTLTARLGPKET